MRERQHPRRGTQTAMREVSVVLFVFALLASQVFANPSTDCTVTSLTSNETACRENQAECSWTGATCADRSSAPCTTNLGWTHPPSPCTDAAKCTSVFSSYQTKGITQISTAETAPSLCNGVFNGTNHDDGAPSTINVPGTPSIPSVPTTRSFCKYVPPGATAVKPVPLVLFFHGTSGDAKSAWSLNWRTMAESADSAFGANGYALVGLQALNRHWVASASLGGQDGSNFDFIYRNYEQHDDVRYVDAVIDEMVANNNVNRSLIYVTGWSNGAYFGAMYATIRSGKDIVSRGGFSGYLTGFTPQGNRVAAVSLFSGANPFDELSSCPMSPTMEAKMPTQLYVYACDFIVCDVAQRYVDNVSEAGTGNSTLVVLADGGETTTTECTAAGPAGCSASKRAQNHLTYPSAMVPDMLTFLEAFISPEITRTPTDTLIPTDSSSIGSPTKSIPATPSATKVPTLTPIGTDTKTRSESDTVPPTPTDTRSATRSGPTPSSTLLPTPSETLSSTNTPPRTDTESVPPTRTPTESDSMPTRSLSLSRSLSNTKSTTSPPTRTETPSPTESFSGTATIPPTRSTSFSPSGSASGTETIPPTRSNTFSNSISTTVTPAPTPTATYTTVTPEPTRTPTDTLLPPTDTLTVSKSREKTTSKSDTISPPPTPSAQATPTPVKTETKNLQPSVTAEETASKTYPKTNTMSPSITPPPTRTPTAPPTPTAEPSSTLSPTVTPAPTPSPTEVPTPSPTKSIVSYTLPPTPTHPPTGTPTNVPTRSPTVSLTAPPTRTPSWSDSQTTHTPAQVSETLPGTRSGSVSPSATRLETPSMSATMTPAPTNTMSVSQGPTVSPEGSRTKSWTPPGTVSPSRSVSGLTPSATPLETLSRENSRTRSMTHPRTLSGSVSGNTGSLSISKGTPSSSETHTVVPPPTSTGTATGSGTRSFSRSETRTPPVPPTGTLTDSATPTPSVPGTTSFSVSVSQSSSPSRSMTRTASFSQEPPRTRTFTSSGSVSRTRTHSATSTASPTMSATASSSKSFSRTSTKSLSLTPSLAITPSEGPSQTQPVTKSPTLIPQPTTPAPNTSAPTTGAPVTDAPQTDAPTQANTPAPTPAPTDFTLPPTEVRNEVLFRFANMVATASFNALLADVERLLCPASCGRDMWLSGIAGVVYSVSFSITAQKYEALGLPAYFLGTHGVLSVSSKDPLPDLVDRGSGLVKFTLYRGCATAGTEPCTDQQMYPSYVTFRSRMMEFLNLTTVADGSVTAELVESKSLSPASNPTQRTLQGAAYSGYEQEFVVAMRSISHQAEALGLLWQSFVDAGEFTPAKHLFRSLAGVEQFQLSASLPEGIIRDMSGFTHRVAFEFDYANGYYPYRNFRDVLAAKFALDPAVLHLVEANTVHKPTEAITSQKFVVDADLTSTQDRIVDAAEDGTISDIPGVSRSSASIEGPRGPNAAAPEDSGLGGGLIALIVILCLLALLIAALIARRQYKKQQAEKNFKRVFSDDSFHNTFAVQMADIQKSGVFTPEDLDLPDDEVPGGPSLSGGVGPAASVELSKPPVLPHQDARPEAPISKSEIDAM